MIRQQDARRLTLALVGAAIWIALATIGAAACDQFASRVIARAIQPSIEALECGDLSAAGLDVAEHRLESVCYTSHGTQSELTIVADLSCGTGGGALIPARISDKVTATAQIRGADCAVLNVSFTSAGQLGNILASAFDVDGMIRNALAAALAGVC